MPKDKNGILGTIIFHNILFLILFFFGFIEPKEPPGIESITINFGDEEYGSGTSEPGEMPEIQDIPEQSVPPAEDISVVDDSRDEILTQDFEKAPPVQKKKSENCIITSFIRKTEENIIKIYLISTFMQNQARVMIWKLLPKTAE